jgi:hypothetical protein
MIKSIAALAIFLAVFAVSKNADARIVKCVDEKGKVTYTDMGCSAQAQRNSKVTVTNNAMDSSHLKAFIQREEQERQMQEQRDAAASQQRREADASKKDNEARQKALKAATTPHPGAKKGQLTSNQRRILSEMMRDQDAIGKEARKVLCDDATKDYTGRGLTASQQAAAAQCAGYDVPIPPPPVVQNKLPTTPSVITSCDPAGCWDNNGIRYNKGAGATHVPSNGDPACQLINGQMHCP